MQFILPARCRRKGKQKVKEYRMVMVENLQSICLGKLPVPNIQYCILSLNDRLTRLLPAVNKNYMDLGSMVICH